MDTSNPENIVRVFWDKVEYDRLAPRLFGLHLAVTRLDDFGNESEPEEIR